MSTVVEAGEVLNLGVPETVLDTKWARDFSEAMAYAHGYQIDIAVSDTLSTSMTSLSLADRKIRVQVSRKLVERAEDEDRLDFLGFNVLHELGHVKRYIQSSPTEPATKKDEYFSNIVEDIAINYDAARQTRFFADLTRKAYDNYLFPQDQRASIAAEPRHKQFMEATLLLAMTTNIHRKLQTPESLAETLTNIGCGDLDGTVVDMLAKVVNFPSSNNLNLLQQIREYGEDLPYYDRMVGYIRTMYDELYKADQNDQDQQRPNSSEPGDGSPSGDNQFDYSNSGGCQHDENHTNIKPSESGEEGKTSVPSDSDTTGTNSVDNPDIAAVGRKIGEQIAEAIEKAKNSTGSEQKPTQLSEEQLSKLRAALGLGEADFQGFLSTVDKYRGEIASVTDLILQLRRERQDNFLAPSHEVSSRGRRIHIGKLLGYLASGSLEVTPDIWKTPAFKEKVEFDFDGADFYFECDVSQSMEGDKANAAAESAVILSQGIQDASFESYDDVPPVRIQVQAFGSGDETLCELSASPANADLGRMYKSLRNPTSNSTQVSGALSRINPAEGRLTVVVVLSDGQFHDETAAQKEAKRLEEKGAVIVQCIFGGANVSNLSDSAKRMNVQSAADLPNYLFGIMPELIEVLRSTHHA